MTETIIRHALRSDGPDLLTMIGELARHHGDEPHVSLDQLAADLFGQSSWVSALVAECTATLVGYVILTRTYRAQLGQRGLDLHHLFVVSSCRGQGIGSQLVQAALDEARRLNCTYLVVGTHPGNVRAQQLYESLGFERITPGPHFRLRI